MSTVGGVLAGAACGRQVMPAAGGALRTAHRCAAVDAGAPWGGFPAHATRARQRHIHSRALRQGAACDVHASWSFRSCAERIEDRWGRL